MEMQLSEFMNSELKLREEILDMIRSRVADLGVRLSLLLVDFFFIESEDDEEKLVNNFETLRELLEPKLRVGKRMLVVDRILALLETGKKQVRDRAKLKKLKGKAKEEIIPFQSRNPEIVYKFYVRIMSLEDILSASLRRPVLWRDGFIRDFNMCDKELDAIAKEIDELRSFSRVDDRSPIRERMDAKVRQLWIGFKLYQ